MHHDSPNLRKAAFTSGYARLAVLLISAMGCDAASDGNLDASISGASTEASDTQSWLLYGVADDGTPITTRIERSKSPPVNLRESKDLSFSIAAPDGATVHGPALVSDQKRVLFGEVDGPASGHHWDEESPMVWIPLGDTPDGATVSLTSARTRLGPVLVPHKDWSIRSSHLLEELNVSGPPESRINIVIMGDGYTADEASKFQSDSSAVATFLFSTRPYDEYRSLFNVYRIFTESPESGADHPDLGIDVLNRFSSSFNCGGVPRALCTDNSQVLNTVYEHLPETDQVLLLVNDDRYGGTGGQVATVSTHELSPFIAVHEFGHSLARLADEYETATGNQGIVAPEANVSLSSVFDEIKWNHWIDSTTILPTFDQLATSDVEPIGAYEGARYHSSGIFRPAPSCKMRVSESELCAVCVEATVRRFHAQSSLITSAMPVASEAINIATRTAPIEFQIELSDLPDLDVRWFVDGEEIGTGNSFTLEPSAIAADAETLRVQVVHTTELVRSDPTGLLTEDVEWDLTDGVVEVEEEPAGCGCQHSSSPSTGMALGLLLFVMTRRKRKIRVTR